MNFNVTKCPKIILLAGEATNVMAESIVLPSFVAPLDLKHTLVLIVVVLTISSSIPIAVTLLKMPALHKL